MRQNGVLSYLLADHTSATLRTSLGSTSLVMETRYRVASLWDKPWGDVRFATANQTLPTRYKAWGEERYSSAYAPTNYTYTGQYSYTGGFGLMFYNARWYDPYLNHFTQPDTIVPDLHNSQDWDRYSYSRNNPLRYTDPSGHCPEEDYDCRRILKRLLPWPEHEKEYRIIGIAIKYGIELPAGVDWAYHDESDYPMTEQHIPIFPIDKGSSSMSDVKEPYGGETLYDDKVYITNFAFEQDEIHLVGTLVHESRHAWQEDSYENLGNPLNLPDDADDLHVVTEADAYTVQKIWLEQHGASLDSFDSEKRTYYVQKMNGLLLDLILPLPLPLPWR